MRERNPDLMGLGRERQDALVKQDRLDQPPLVGKNVAEPGHDIEIGGMLGKTLAERSLGIDRIARAKRAYCLLDGESRWTALQIPGRWCSSHRSSSSRSH